MSLCVLCGIETNTAEALCAYHPGGTDADWAHSNRVMCDFVHRGVVPAATAVAMAIDVDLVPRAA
jgi:hypothetical protein